MSGSATGPRKPALRRARLGSIAALACLGCLAGAIVRYAVWDLETTPARTGGVLGAVLVRIGPLLCVGAAVLFLGALWLWFSDREGG